MASFSSTTMIGNLTRDPKTHATKGKTTVTNFGLAVNDHFTDNTGNHKEAVNFFEWKAFGKRADTIAKWLNKGSPLFVTGYPRQESWVDKNTKDKKSRVVFIVDKFQFIGGKKVEQEKDTAIAAAAQAIAETPNPVSDDTGDELPL
jgi:single-strand DNA-binding protein